ncbi:MAG: flagellar hook-basal body complex protein [Pseudomonadota bacterium]
MSISSSLNAGVSGLNANASALGTISDNIANSGTFGYKRADVDFSSVVISETEGAYSAGGVTVDPYREVDGRGSLVSTSNSTDLAVGGQGMLPVTTSSAVDDNDPDPPLMLVSTGSFRTDEDGYLVSESGLVLMGFPADANGNIPNVPRDSAEGLVPVQINQNQFASEPTTEMSIGANLPSEATDSTDPIGGTPYTLDVAYIDNVGGTETLTFTFTPNATDPQSNEWTATLTDSALGATVGEFTILFDNSSNTGGSIFSVNTAGAFGESYDPNTGIADITVGRGPIAVNIGATGTDDGLTQLDAEFAPTNITKNGAAVGTLTSIEVDENGFLEGAYDNGFTQTLYQIPLADVPNPNGLTAVDNQAFMISADSGPFYLWDAGKGPTGEIIGFAREESTADIAAELTRLIQTQRAYSSNATVIRTVDEMLQETTNLKR